MATKTTTNPHVLQARKNIESQLENLKRQISIKKEELSRIESQIADAEAALKELPEPVSTRPPQTEKPTEKPQPKETKN